MFALMLVLTALAAPFVAVFIVLIALAMVAFIAWDIVTP